MTTRVYKYSVYDISGDTDYLDDMYGASRYYNFLTAVNQAKFDHYRGLRRKWVPTLEDKENALTELSSSIDDIREKLKKARQKSRKRVTLDEADKNKLSHLLETRRALSAEVKSLRTKFKDITSSGDNAFKDRTKGLSPHKKREANQRVLAEMLEEDWHPAWKELAEATAKARELSNQARKAPWTGKDRTSFFEGSLEELEKQLPSEGGRVLMSGTYLAVESAVQLAAASKTKKSDPTGKRLRPRKIGSQILPVITTKDLYEGTCSRIQVVSRKSPQGLKDSSRWKARSSSSKRNYHEYTSFSLRIGQMKEGRTVTLNVKVHRPLPLDAKITWIYLVPEKVGNQVKYSLQFTVNLNEATLPEKPRGTGVCEVRLGWSRMKEDLECDKKGLLGVRIATINGEPFELDGPEYVGRHTSVTPKADRKQGSRRARGFFERGGAFAGLQAHDRFKSYADRYFEAARKKFIEWTTENQSTLPSWVVDEMKAKPPQDGRKARGSFAQVRGHGLMRHIARQWSSKIELPDGISIQSLWNQWKLERKSRRLDLYSDDWVSMVQWFMSKGVTSNTAQFVLCVEWWRRKDCHLYEMASNLRRKATANRRQQYQVKANELARQYDTCVVNKLDIQSIAKKKEVDRDSFRTTAERYRQYSAPGEFREALQKAFGSRLRDLRKEESSTEAT